MNPLKRQLLQILRSTINPRPVHRLKLNTVFRLTFILLLGGSGLTACANLQQAQTAHKQGNDATFSFAEYLKTRAEQGDAEAQRLVGNSYWFGSSGFPQDYEKAAYWLGLAAEQGNVEARDDLGILYVSLGLKYDQGEGVEQDDEMAVYWYKRAAELGDATSAFVLYVNYSVGKGVEEDDEMAMQWLRKAAELGDALSQRLLARMYEKGRGVPKNYKLAVHWYRKLAEQGDVSGHIALSRVYEKGRGVPKNYVYAYMWMDIASDDDGFEGEGRRALEEFEKEMTPSQIQKAKELARACERKQYKDCEV